MFTLIFITRGLSLMSNSKDEHFNQNNVETVKQKIMKMTYYIYSLILYNIFKVIAKKK